MGVSQKPFRSKCALSLVGILMDHDLRYCCTERTGTYVFSTNSSDVCTERIGTFMERTGTYQIKQELWKGCTERIGTYTLRELFCVSHGGVARNVQERMRKGNILADLHNCCTERTGTYQISS